MCSRNHWKNSPLMPLGMLCLAIGLMLPRIFHPAGQPGLNWIHFASGFLLGISIVFNLAGFWMRVRQRRCE